MQYSDLPPRIPVPFAESGLKNTIPVPSQVSITPGAASFTTGFPPLTMTPIAAGGVPPFGQDMNGILNEISAWARWQGAGGPVPYDAAFAAAIGGYPKGAVIAGASAGAAWVSLVDNNLTNPGAGGAGWASYLQNGVANINASTVLAPDQAGLVLASAAAGNVTLTLPAANAAGGRPLRFTIIRTDVGANTVTVQRSGADLINGIASVPVTPRDRLTLASDGAAAWYAVGAGAFEFSPGSSGYYRTPGEGLMQWGTAVLPASGAISSSVNVVLPVAFRVSMLQAVATPRGPMNSGTGRVPLVTVNAFGVTGFTVYGEAPDNTTLFNQAVNVSWWAVGN